MSPKLSIIVPVYNAEKYLDRCVNSIMHQTFQDFELILVDDGSMDASGKMCDEYGKKYTNIKIIHQMNGGIGSARNTGILNSTGEFIGFVDNDDFISPIMFENLIQVAIETNSDIVSCNHQKLYDFSEGRSQSETLLTQYNIISYNPIQALHSLYKGENLQWLVWDKIFRRSLFENCLFEKVVVMEDVLILPQLLYKSEKTTYLDAKFYFYYVRKGSTINSSLSFEKFISSMYAFSKLREFFKDKDENTLFEYAEMMYCSSIINWKIRIDKTEVSSKKINLEVRKLIKQNYFSFLKNSIISFQIKLLLSLSILSLRFMSIYSSISQQKLK